MNKYIVFIIILLHSILSYAESSYLSSEFRGKSGCFIVYDVNKNQIIERYNPARCSEKIPPDSTFKIALSLMAFDQKLISQNTIFKWDGKDKGLAFWNQDQTPESWLKNSAVWVSRELTTRLGIDKIKYYLKKFKYGNRNFSGDPGKNNALMHAWINSSLKISADEQLTFLKGLLTEKLRVSRQAMEDTKKNMYLETSPHGWKLYGKTGTDAKEFPDGWFVGFTQKDNRVFVFVLNFTEQTKQPSPELAGKRAKMLTKTLLTKMHLL